MMPTSREIYRTGNRPAPETPAGRALRSAVLMVLDGHDPAEVARQHGLPQEVVRTAVEEFHANGSDVFEGIVPHSARPSRRKLSQEQERELHALICWSAPDGSGRASRLWNKDTVRELIEERCGLLLPQRTLATYLERWGFAPEKPWKALYRQQPSVLREWMRRDYPIVALQAREEKGLLYWWGSAPVIGIEHAKVDPTRERSRNARPVEEPELSLMFVVSNRGNLHWMVHPGAPTEAILIDLLERLIQQQEQKLILIVQDHPLFATPGFISWSFAHRTAIAFNLFPGLVVRAGSQGETDKPAQLRT